MTPLLTRIEQELAVCTTPLQEAELLAERACYFARTGNFAGANAIAASLRQVYGDGRSARISVWIMLIEGLILFFESDTQKSRDRIYRAYAISKSAGLSRLRPLAGAWLAHMEFERAQYEAMASIIIEILDAVDSSAHEVVSRLGMVLGDAYLYAGDRPQSQHWYEQSRRHSTATGDQAAVGALMYNRAAFGLATLRASEYADNVCLDNLHLDFVELELESAISFQLGTGVTALTYLIDLCKARIAVLRGRFESAALMFFELRERAQIAHNSADRVSVDIDLALCLVKSGRLDKADKIVSALNLTDIDRLDIDDKLVAVCILTQIAQISKIIPFAFNDEINAVKIKAAYLANMKELRIALEKVEKVATDDLRLIAYGGSR